jgi:hypothetical protein
MNKGNQNWKWTEMGINMGNNFNGFVAPNKAMEPLIQLTKVQQQQSLRMSQAWINHLWKMGDAGRSGDAKNVWETCMESNNDFISACQESLKEQATACHELFRTFIPANQKSTSDGA